MDHLLNLSRQYGICQRGNRLSTLGPCYHWVLHVSLTRSSQQTCGTTRSSLASLNDVSCSAGKISNCSSRIPAVSQRARQIGRLSSLRVQYSQSTVLLCPVASSTIMSPQYDPQGLQDIRHRLRRCVYIWLMVLIPYGREYCGVKATGSDRSLSCGHHSSGSRPNREGLPLCEALWPAAGTVVPIIVCRSATKLSKVVRFGWAPRRHGRELQVQPAYGLGVDIALVL